MLEFPRHDGHDNQRPLSDLVLIPIVRGTKKSFSMADWDYRINDAVIDFRDIGNPEYWGGAPKLYVTPYTRDQASWLINSVLEQLNREPRFPDATPRVERSFSDAS